jgi:cytochrome P450
MRFDPLADYSDYGSFRGLVPQADDEPIAFDPRTNAFYVIRYEDVLAWLDSPKLTTRRLSESPERLSPTGIEVRDEMRSRNAKWPLFSDGDYHDRVRAHLKGAFRQSEREIRRGAATAHLAQVLRAGNEVDWVREAAEPTALSVLSSLLGAPLDEVGELVAQGVRVVECLELALKTEPKMRAAVEGMREIERWLREVLAAESRERTGFVSALAAIERDPGLGMSAAAAALSQVVTGSFDPLVSTLTTFALVVRPAELEALNGRELVDEVIRVATPFRFARRFAREGVQICGTHIPKGSLVFFVLVTANLDEDPFPRPLNLEGGRRGRHLAFGRGEHACPGEPIVRSCLLCVREMMLAERLYFVPTEVRCNRNLNIRKFEVATGKLTAF